MQKNLKRVWICVLLKYKINIYILKRKRKKSYFLKYEQIRKGFSYFKLKEKKYEQYFNIEKVFFCLFCPFQFFFPLFKEKVHYFKLLLSPCFVELNKENTKGKRRTSKSLVELTQIHSRPDKERSIYSVPFFEFNFYNSL